MALGVAADGLDHGENNERARLGSRGSATHSKLNGAASLPMLLFKPRAPCAVSETTTRTITSDCNHGHCVFRQ